MEEQDWQPVRISKAGGIHGKTDTDDAIPSEERVRFAGKIVRVRRSVNDGWYICGGEVFEIHPNDYPPNGAFICEHQILAD